MNRIVRMVLGNFFYVPGAFAKLCRYAKNTEKYSLVTLIKTNFLL